MSDADCTPGREPRSVAASLTQSVVIGADFGCNVYIMLRRRGCINRVMLCVFSVLRWSAGREVQRHNLFAWISFTWLQAGCTLQLAYQGNNDQRVSTIDRFQLSICPFL